LGFQTLFDEIFGLFLLELISGLSPSRKNQEKEKSEEKAA